jgi:hypothetical protein
VGVEVREAFERPSPGKHPVGRNDLRRAGFKPAAVIAGAWDFGNRPSLEGGGIFQPGLQYGGGVDVYLSEHIVLRVDFRETISAQPDFWTRSHASIREFDLGEGLRAEPGALIKHGPLRHQVFTLGQASPSERGWSGGGGEWARARDTGIEPAAYRRRPCPPLPLASPPRP